MAEAVGMLEVFGLATAFAAADAGCKAGNVWLENFDKNKPGNADELPVPLIVMIKFRGSVSDVQAALEAAKAKAEKYAKITSKTIINSSGGDAASYGQNAYFYDAAEGLLTAVILLIAEYCPPEKRHIISVFKLIQDLLAPSGVKGKNQFQLLMDKLPPDHKAKWFAGSALNTGDQAMASVMSTALSRLNAFLDSELEQILCFDTVIDAERFCNTKSAIFVVLPEEDATKYFMASLIVQQLYRELLAVADEQGGKLKNRVMFYLDEIGTIPKIESLEMAFSAVRSRRCSIVAIIPGNLSCHEDRSGSDDLRLCFSVHFG